MKFRKNPIEVEAVQFTGDNWAEMHAFTGHRFLPGQTNADGSPAQADVFNPPGTYLVGYLGENVGAELWVAANGSHLPIEVGEWVVQDSLGFYPIKAEKFAETYTPVVEEEEDVYFPEKPHKKGDRIEVHGKRHGKS